MKKTINELLSDFKARCHKLPGGQIAVAERMGITGATLRNYFSRRTPIPLERAQQLSILLPVMEAERDLAKQQQQSAVAASLTN